MESISVGQVVLATFPFSDLTSKKVRPCLVLGMAEFNDVILCQITSQPYESRIAVDLTRSDFKQGSVIVDSFIRPDKIATLDRATISQIIGRITDTKLTEVKKRLTQIFELNNTS